MITIFDGQRVILIKTMRTISLAILFLLGLCAAGQEFTLLQPQVTTCSGTLYDSGGPTSAYGPNELLTTLICPDQSNSRASISFTVFSLSNSPAPGDVLTIYDGTSLTAPLLGQYTGQSLNDLTITASDLNPSGCLLLVFTSNATNGGNIIATIGCLPQCSQPIASFTSMGDTLVACPGAPVAIDASASQAAPGQSIAQWSWLSSPAPSQQLGEWPTGTLVFDGPGIYNVRLQVTDGADCASQPTEPLTVVVTPPVHFTGTSAPAEACVGSSVSLVGLATIDSLVIATQSGVDHGNGLEIPDVSTFPVTSYAFLGGYPEGAVINDPEELGDICITMEHSFMSDLTIRLICPNDQSVMLHQQGGGGTFIGDADDATGFTVGTCWTYCFSAAPDFGTWAQCASNGSTPNVTPVTNGTALQPGTYTPVEPLDSLVGCPMNGLWRLEFWDLWGFDDGHLCSWSLGTSPLLDSSFIQLSPSLDLQDPTATSWSGPGAVPGTPPTQAQVALPAAGQNVYTFSVTDSQGCLHDTTLVIEALPYPDVDAGPDVDLCAGPGQLQGSVQWPDVDSCMHYLILRDVMGDGWNSGASLQVDLNGVSSTYTLSPSSLSDTIAFAIAAGQQITLIYTAGTFWNNENSFELYNDEWTVLYDSPLGPATGTLYQGVIACSAFQLGSISWSPVLGLGTPNELQTSVAPPASGWYTLTATWAGLCAASDSVFVVQGGQPLVLAYDTLADQLCVQPAGFDGYTWLLNGTFHSSTVDPCITAPPIGAWIVTAIDQEGCSSVSPEVLVCPVLAIEENSGMLSTTPMLGQYTWQWNSTTISMGTSASVTVQGPGSYIVTLFMNNGCVVQATYELEDTSNQIEHGSSGPFAVRVVPNPHRGSFRLLVPGAAGTTVLATVLDVSGRTVHQQRSHILPDGRTSEWDLSLTSGTYIVEVLIGSNRHRARMVVE